eukprot:NODE_2809_length_1116_cov_24.537020_g2578_i0.p1 GENE.NODE_2809_length_1116_cov_24.537020_g2578_i0~~NODE_2809_length_1116_cov_24.537020_g2578_i0.p1  ORF type:complete len:326 (+),score=52.94 NODE_2809_length_1116_cov_24.537020_g2578_i0:117-980(+)
MAERRGASVRRIPMTKHDCRLDIADLNFTSKTRLVAVTLAANSCGTLPDVVPIIAAAKAAGSLTYLDAVHFAPHSGIDVAALGCDFLVCSAYKFFGPHVGVLYGRRQLLQNLQPMKLRPSTNDLPSQQTAFGSRWEIGTPNFEGLAGFTAAVEYLASLGLRFGAQVPPRQHARRREAILAGMNCISDHEKTLTERFLAGTSAIPGVTVHGVPSKEGRTPTFCITKEGRRPEALAEALVARGIACGAGNFYALETARALGLDSFLRVGFVHYNTLHDVDRALTALEDA